MNRDQSSRVILRIFAFLAIIVGTLTLLGVRPMNSRTIEVVLGAAAVIAGFALLIMIRRHKAADSPPPVA
jgi:uncharacterized membrane protein HdeD (DUF308 family)